MTAPAKPTDFESIKMTENLKVMPVTPCGYVSKCMSSPSSYASEFSSYSKPTPARVATRALAALDEARKKDVATHEANLPSIENNLAIVAQVEAIMAAIGMPKKYSERDTNSRARYPKTITKEAGYLGDLRRHVPTSDGFDSATLTYNSLLTRYKEYETQAKAQEIEAQRRLECEQAAVIEKRKADMVLAGILLRYELPVDSSWEDVLEALRSRDQRLDLAVAMNQTRNDWNDGPYRVRDALGRFTITTDEDKNIAADVAECLYDFEDGRVFRDTTWNYSALFASVADQQLAADVQKAMQMTGDV